MKHKYIYITENIAKRSETQAYNRYKIVYPNKTKEDFLTFRNSLRSDISFLRSNNKENSIDGGKYEEGCTRLVLSNEVTDANEIQILNKIIGSILQDKKTYEQYDKNLNGLSLEELQNEFQKKLKEIDANEHNEVEQMGYSNQSSNYDIVQIDSFEKAKEFYKFCIHKKFNNRPHPTEWCLTYAENFFYDYSNNGINQIYFCIQKGIKEDDEPIQGEGHPQDDYGNSMISVIVDGNGDLAYATSRWNHELDGSDQCYSVVDISRIVGVDFYKTFLPNHKFQDVLDKAMDIFHKTGSLDGFETYYKKNKGDIYTVFLNDKCSLLDTNKGEIITKWFDFIDYFNNGYAIVEDFSKGTNYIDINGKLISDIWFDRAKEFNNGFGEVQIKTKGWNFINPNGELLSNIWFNESNFFYNSFACVYLKEKGWNLIDTNGNYVSYKWFDDAYIDYPDYATVEIDNKYYSLDIKGDLYDKKGNFIKNVSPQQDGEQIANESLRDKYAKELNEVLDLNKRIKKLYK